MSAKKGTDKKSPRIVYTVKNPAYGETIQIVSDSMEEAKQLREEAIELAYSTPRAFTKGD